MRVFYGREFGQLKRDIIFRSVEDKLPRNADAIAYAILMNVSQSEQQRGLDAKHTQQVVFEHFTPCISSKARKKAFLRLDDENLAAVERFVESERQRCDCGSATVSASSDRLGSASEPDRTCCSSGSVSEPGQDLDLTSDRSGSVSEDDLTSNRSGSVSEDDLSSNGPCSVSEPDQKSNRPCSVSEDDLTSTEDDMEDAVNRDRESDNVLDPETDRRRCASVPEEAGGPGGSGSSRCRNQKKPHASFSLMKQDGLICVELNADRFGDFVKFLKSAGCKFFFTTYREYFGEESEYVLNYVRMFSFYCAGGEPLDDMTTLYYYMLARISFCLEKRTFSHSSIVKHFDNPFLSCCTAAGVQHLKKPSKKSARRTLSPRGGLLMSKALNVPAECGSNGTSRTWVLATCPPGV